MWPVFGFFWFVFVVFVLFGVGRWMIWGRRRGGHGCGPGYYAMGPNGDAEAILRTRLAKGEIDEPTYEQLLGVLRR
ncbi:MAG: SHOCT domain-containing protein [Sulfobacillus sp.]